MGNAYVLWESAENFKRTVGEAVALFGGRDAAGAALSDLWLLELPVPSHSPPSPLQGGVAGGSTGC